MGSRGGGGGGAGIPPASRKMVQSLKEIVNGVPDSEIYSTLKDCNMDPNEAVNRLLSQDTFHEVKSKREKKKEHKDTTESRPRGGGSTSNRGGRSGTDRYAGRSGSTHFNSSEPGGLHGKPTYKRENGLSSFTSSTTPATRVASRNANWHPQSYSESLGVANEPLAYNVADAVPVPQPSSGYQSAWVGAPGQKSMADIVKMGRPQNKVSNTSNASQPNINHNLVPEIHPEHDASPHNEWPSIEKPPAVCVVDTHADSGLDLAQSNLSFDRSNEYVGYETNVVEPQEESSSEDDVEDHVGPASVTEPHYDDGSYNNMDSYHHHDDASDNKVEEVEPPMSSVSANMQKLAIQEEPTVQPDEDVPSVVIPNHLQVHSADCSHLSFGSFGVNMNPGFSGPSSAEHSETTNLEYYEDASARTLAGAENYEDASARTLAGAENYELPSASQTAVMKQEDSEVTHSSQNQYGFSHNNQLLEPSFPQSQTPPQTQISTPFLNVMQAAANGHPAREPDLSYSQFSVSQSMPSRYANSASSISDPTISMAEALKTVGLSSSQPLQQNLSTGPAVPQHLLHPYSQPTLPLGPFAANMIGYPFLAPQSYTYMPSGFQPAYAGNSTYHQQLAAMLPQYKNSISASSLPQSAASGYGSFGGSTTIPGNYQVSQSSVAEGSAINYEDALRAHYKDNSHLLSLQQQQQQLQQQNENWLHGGGSRTMPAVAASAYYNLQGQSQQQPSGFRQGQQPSQSYGGAPLNYPDFFHSQPGMSQEQHQLQQNSREASLGGGSQGQPKLQSQQLWQNGY